MLDNAFCTNLLCHLEPDHDGKCNDRLGEELGELAAAEAWDRTATTIRARLAMRPPPMDQDVAVPSQTLVASSDDVSSPPPTIPCGAFPDEEPTDPACCDDVLAALLRAS